MGDTTYNGHSNYATWLVNVEYLQDTMDAWCQDGIMFNDTRELADAIKEELATVLDNEGCSGLSRSWADAFLSDVDYGEIADSWKEELTREDQEQCDDCSQWFPLETMTDGMCPECHAAWLEQEEPEPDFSDSSWTPA